MSKDKTIGPGIALGAFIAVVFASLGLLSCGGGGGGSEGVGGLSCTGASCTPVTPGTTPPPLPLAATCTATAGNVTLNAGAARASGVAPLAVFFDATTTTSSINTARPFHDIEYRWDFGDASGSPVSGTTWANGSRPGVSSRNTATGPVAAHVFEWTGGSASSVVYDIKVTAIDEITNPPAKCTIQVTVQNPDAVFSGANTICIAAASTPTAGSDGCPAGAQTVASQPDFSTIISTYLASGRRVLLKHDDTFTSGITNIIAVTGPGTIGTYGIGAKAVIRATADNINLIQLSSGTTPNTTSNLQDWRFMDLDFEGNTHVGVYAISPQGGINQVTQLRLVANAVYNAFTWSDSILDYWNTHGNTGHTLWDQIATVDCNSNNITGSSAGLSAFVTASRYALMGSNLNNNLGGEHTVRVQFANRAVISNNTMQGQAATKEAFTLRARIFGGTGAAVNAGSNGVTQYVVVSDNKFLGNGGDIWTLYYGPQAAANDERVSDTITERNWFTAGSGTQRAFVLQGQNQTVRNNVFDSSGAQSHGGIQITSNPVYVPTTWAMLVNVYNNTFYDSDTIACCAGNFNAVIIDANSSNTTLKNNLAYAPNDSNHVMISGTGIGLVQSNNSSDAQVGATNPLFTSVSPFNPTNAKITSGSYAIGGGTTVPVWSDFFLTTQASPRDMGAVVH